MKEHLHRIKGIREDVPGVGPPFTSCFARPRHHGIYEHDQVDRSAVTHQGGREPGERLGHQDELSRSPAARRTVSA